MHVVDIRESVFRASVAIFWLASIALAAVLAVRSRDDFYATVKPNAGYLLVAFTVPVVVLAVIAIRSRAILALTVVVAGSVSVASSWEIMRSESSTAAVGILYMPIGVLFWVLVGLAIDYGRRHAARRMSRGGD
ncbi:MAG: hypothetical protein ACRDY4_02155 [Acidimicrobiia bacterium]